MRDVTPEFRRYREAARHVHNAYMRDLPDGPIEFPDLNRALFRSIFQAAISADDLSVDSLQDRSVFRQLRVVTNSPIMIADEGAEGVDWRIVDSPRDELVLTFISLFDWDWESPDRDFELIECYVQDSASSEVKVGTRALINAATAKILADDTVKPWRPSRLAKARASG